MANSIRGDGLARAQRALAELERDPQLLDRARVRRSPPLYTSDLSDTTTRSASSNQPSEEEQLRQQQRSQLALDASASRPHEQHKSQAIAEEKRIFEAHLNGTHHAPDGVDFSDMANEKVKERWVEQGIWNDTWDSFVDGRWKHEEPLELELESETDSEAESFSISSYFPAQPQRKPRRPKSDKEKQRIAERRVTREREREASRPYHQFIYQISKERERIQDDYTNREVTGISIPNINTKAYENVKSTWTKRGIWKKKWGILPGMSWKHENIDKEIADGVAALANPTENSNHETRKAPYTITNGAPFGNIFTHPITYHFESSVPSPVDSNHRQLSGVMNTSQQGLSTDTNDDVRHTLSAPNSPRFQMSKWFLRSTTAQAIRPSRKKSSHNNEQPQPAKNAFLGPAHSSEISKPTGKEKPAPHRRPRISENVSSGGLLFSAAVDTAEVSLPPGRGAPRRSNRIKRPVAKDPIMTASTDCSKRAVRPKAERKVANNRTSRRSAKLGAH